MPFRGGISQSNPRCRGARNASHKILLVCRDVFSGNLPYSGGNYTLEFWDEIHKMLQYRHGRFKLADGNPQSTAEDAVSFLLECEDEEFLDFVEYIFKVDSLFHVVQDENNLVADINELFASENAGYE